MKFSGFWKRGEILGFLAKGKILGVSGKGGRAILCFIFEEEVFWIFLQSGEILDSFAEGGNPRYFCKGERFSILL